ncbi:MAG: hypothetical protein CMJ30_02065 [Phycisphaerae bacterium]|nr:hypothetical protein [Phycisphaerae bacterium]
MSETPRKPSDDERDLFSLPEDCQDVPGLDELVNSGWQPESDEAEQLMARLDPLEALRATPPAEDVLVHATLARIKSTPRAAASKGTSPAFSPAVDGAGSGGFQFRLPDLFGVAASLLLATSIVLALGRGAKLHSRDELCGANIRALGTAVESFASDHRREVPASNWDVVPSLATVRQFVDDGYCPHQRVNCPCCRGEKSGISFYSVQVGPGRIRVDRFDPQRPIVGDPNPLQVASMLGVPAPGPMSGALSHSGRCSHLLLADLSVRSARRPVWINKGRVDAVWVPRGHTSLPKFALIDPQDVFLAR